VLAFAIKASPLPVDDVIPKELINVFGSLDEFNDMLTDFASSCVEKAGEHIEKDTATVVGTLADGKPATVQMMDKNMVGKFQSTGGCW
jgi:hypothetical protein